MVEDRENLVKVRCGGRFLQLERRLSQLYLFSQLSQLIFTLKSLLLLIEMMYKNLHEWRLRQVTEGMQST